MQHYNRLGDRFKGINIVNDQVSNWSKRIYNKFGVITQDETFKEKPTDLVNAFSALEVVVQKELTDIDQRRQEEGDAGGVEYD